MIYNHLEITVKTHWEALKDKERIVGFEVEPRSIARGESRSYNPLDTQKKQILKPGEPFYLTYSIYRVNDANTKWASRMDHYYKTGNYKIHMEEILMNLTIIVVAGCILWLLIKRTIDNDISSLSQ